MVCNCRDRRRIDEYVEYEGEFFMDFLVKQNKE